MPPEGAGVVTGTNRDTGQIAGALAAECELVSRATSALGEADFALPTRCSAWNVKELLAHMHRGVDRINIGLASPPKAPVDTDSVTYWRRYDPTTDGVAIGDRAKEVALSHPTGAALAAAWDDVWRRALEAVRGSVPTRSIETWGPVLSLDEFLKTRVLEMTVHGTDLADALGSGPWATRAGVEITNEILLALLNDGLPSDLGWDDLTLLEKGCGRRQLSEEEAGILGRELAPRFPLIR